MVTDGMVQDALLAFWGRPNYTTEGSKRVEKSWTDEQMAAMRAAIESVDTALWDEINRVRTDLIRLREWVDTEGRDCPSNDSVDRALASRDQQEPTS